MQNLDQLIQERRRRIRLTKRLLRPLPRRATLHRYPILKWFAAAARKRPYLWSFRASAMTPAFYAGSIITLLPVYGFQIAFALIAAVALRANLPTLAGLQLLSTPLTAPIILPATFYAGDFCMRWFTSGEPGGGVAYFGSRLTVGGIVCGLILGCVLDLTCRFLAYEARKHHWHL
ncbi:MAG: DUF2062 domain-containing protein, partial [Opitutaceae bacterium]